jgi:hypothetical protein
MIRTHIIPETNNVQVTVPDNYIGKKVEVIVFTEEEGIENKSDSKTKPGNISKYKGILNLSKERYDDFQKHAKDIRDEWEREY